MLELNDVFINNSIAIQCLLQTLFGCTKLLSGNLKFEQQSTVQTIFKTLKKADI